MQGHHTKYRFKEGDVVLCTAPSVTYGQVSGHGIIRSIDVEKTIIYLGKNEWLTEYTTYASVEFVDGIKNIKLADLITASQVKLYDSLRPGDFVVYGKRKQARGLVLSVNLRPTWKNYIIMNRVIILEDGIRKTLPLRHEIISINRA